MMILALESSATACSAALCRDGELVAQSYQNSGLTHSRTLLPMVRDMLANSQLTLDQVDVKWKPGAACCIVLASGGYPVEYKKGYPISGLEEAGKSAVVFHAGTKKADNGDILTNGGRVLGVTATGDTLPQAIANAYAAAKPISFQDMHFRTDIGKV